MEKLKILTPNRTLLIFRILIYAVSLIHLVITATKLLNIDFEASKDLMLHSYSKLKWRLITTWFNLLTLGYLPICLYCDWRTLRDESEQVHVEMFNQIRIFYFSSLILPSTAFADILFWQLWNKDRELIVPLSTDEFISIWSHHSMHTASLIFVIFDLICVQRRRPSNMLPGIIVLSIFLVIYMFVCFESLLNGEYVYPLLKTMSGYKLIVLAVYFYISNLFFYTGQWIIVDLVHEQNEFADILFWQLWNKDRELIVPLSTDEFISIWSHHSMHTASLIFVIFDLICVQRRRPSNMLPGIIVLSIFLVIYMFVCFESLLNGEYVYPLLKTMSGYKLIVLAVYFYISNLFFYTGQWIIVDLVHEQNEVAKNL